MSITAAHQRAKETPCHWRHIEFAETFTHCPTRRRELYAAQGNVWTCNTRLASVRTWGKGPKGSRADAAIC